MWLILHGFSLNISSSSLPADPEKHRHMHVNLHKKIHVCFEVPILIILARVTCD